MWTLHLVLAKVREGSAKAVVWRWEDKKYQGLPETLMCSAVYMANPSHQGLQGDCGRGGWDSQIATEEMPLALQCFPALTWRLCWAVSLCLSLLLFLFSPLYLAQDLGVISAFS